MTDSLGIWLRRSRESRQLDLDDVVQALRIHRRYLQALEVGDYEALPGPIQARGFLRNYARYLGVSVEDALARYDAEARGQPVQPRIPEVTTSTRRGERTWAPPPPSVEEERAAVRATTSAGLIKLLGGALVFFLLLVVASFLWLQYGVGSNLEPALSPTSRSQSGPIAPAAETATVELPASPAPVFQPAEDGRVQIRLLPTSQAWVSVSADERVVFQGIAQPQQPVQADAGELLIVSTGNAGAFDLFVNGTAWGPLGDQGEIVRRAWSPAGEIALEDS